MTYVCNPMRLDYRYQFFRQHSDAAENLPFRLSREAADPSLVLFRGLYYLFPSMSGGFWTSEDLAAWTYHPFLTPMPIYDYAPDVHPVGEYLYFSASSNQKNCSFFRTRDPLHEPFEELPGTFPFWDPNLFADDDGRIYFFWGCSSDRPIQGVELDPETMRPITEPAAMISANPQTLGYERNGEDHGYDPAEGPYIEGAWLNHHEGKYYLQYAQPGTQVNVYNDAVYVSDHPLGPYVPANNNPYSYCPGGFATGAGHGSTLEDTTGRFWHVSTIGINQNHIFERRIGFWKAGIDADGELFCDQRYSDWPTALETPPFTPPEWMLLSYGKPARASSGVGAERVVNETLKDWWHADSARAGEWVEVDLLHPCDVHAVHINFADHALAHPLPDNMERFPIRLRNVESTRSSIPPAGCWRAPRTERTISCLWINGTLRRTIPMTWQFLKTVSVPVLYV